ncbi:MAG: ABC transporter permease [Chloroflexi bacterium]|nr:ABC transporter permease [Chloroflexota bacterium]
MPAYLARRLALTILVLWGLTLATFVITHLVPGDPAALYLGPKPTQEQIEAVNRKFGFDQPLPVQYVRYMQGVMSGDLGLSLRTKRPVTSELGARFAATFELTTLGMALALAVGLPIGVASARRRGGAVDRLSQVVALSGVAMPAFFMGMLLQLLFHGRLNWLPLQGRLAKEVMAHSPVQSLTGLYLIDTLLTGNWPAFQSTAAHIVLPALTIAFTSVAVVTRMARSAMLEVLSQDYVRTAWAYGLPERLVYYKYALKPALVTVVTVVGLAYGYLLGGSFLVESIFDWPGLGQYAVLSILYNDYPGVMGVTVLYAVSFILVNLAVDLIYHALDPRLKEPGT